MLSGLMLRDYSKMSIELRDLLFQRNQANDWISLLSTNHRTTPLLSVPGTSFSDLEHHLHPSLARSSSCPEDGNCHETDFRSSASAEAVRSAGKSERYKTELCRSFEETGFCKYKDKCQFAHGFQELRNVQRHPKYKTDLCRTYHSTGFCPYGSRCHFIHADLTAPPATSHSKSSGVSEVQGQQLNDLRSKVNCTEASLDQRVGVSREELESFLDAFSRVLQAVSCRPQSPPSTPNFEVAVRQDSVNSGSLRSSPDRLPTPTGFLHDDLRTPYSRITSCSSENDVISCGIQSPTSPTTFFSSNAAEHSALSTFWTMAHPLLNFFET